jgi:hypothetical protein
MAEFKFPCPQCRQHIQCDPGYAGMQIDCPICKRAILVPQPPRPADAPVSARAWRKILVIVALVVALAGLIAGGWFGFSKIRIYIKSGHLPSGLVSLWSGEGNANDSVGRNNGTLMGGASFAHGKMGEAFSFDGDGCVSVPASDSFNFSGNMPMTIATWVYRTGSAPVGHIVGKRNNCYLGEIQYQLSFDEASGVAFVANGGNFWVSTHRELPMNTWQHLAVAYNGTTAIVYINGQSVASGSGSLGTAIAAPLKIGNAGSCQSFAGLIDEVAIFNRALSASEIRAIYAKQK